MWSDLLAAELIMLPVVTRSAPAFAFTAGSALTRLPSIRAPSYTRSYKPTTPLSMSVSSITGKNLVTVDDCLAAFGSAVFLDGSWHLSKERNARAEYEAGPRIEGAKFFDVDDIAAKGELNPKNLPHMMPPKQLFAAAMDGLSISSSDNVVVYGTEGCMFTSRAWYTIREMGHPADKVHLMQGSLTEWEKKGGAIENGFKKSLKASELDLNRVAKYQAEDSVSMVDMDEVLRILADGDKADAIIVDARSAARFRAEVPEPREGIRGGRMPGSLNVPFTDLLDSNDPLKFKSAEDMKRIISSAGVDIKSKKRIVCLCGSGVTACVIAAALEECGRDPSGTFIYDGSWTEWGGDPKTPIVS